MIGTTRQELECLLHRIVPDFRGHPVYVVLASDGLDSEFIPAHSYGLYSDKLDLALRSQLAHRWTGRGPAMIVNDVAMAQDVNAAAGDDPDLVAALLRQRVIATTIHEATHALVAQFDYSEIDNPQVAEFQRLVLSAQVASHCRSSESRLRPAYPWAGHGAKFLRVLLHLIYRAEQILGERIPLSLAFANHAYELSPALAYQAELGNEPETFHRAHFRGLRCLPLPQDFRRLFIADAARWIRDQQNQIPETVLQAA